MPDLTASPVPLHPIDTPKVARAEPVKTDANKQPEKAKKKLTLHTWLNIGAAVVVVIVLALYLSRNLLLGTPTIVYTASSGQLVQNVVASGRVISPQRVTVALQGSGRVLRVAVAEGQAVKPGSC